MIYFFNVMYKHHSFKYVSGPVAKRRKQEGSTLPSAEQTLNKWMTFTQNYCYKEEGCSIEDIADIDDDEHISFEHVV